MVSSPTYRELKRKVSVLKEELTAKVMLLRDMANELYAERTEREKLDAELAAIAYGNNRGKAALDELNKLRSSLSTELAAANERADTWHKAVKDICDEWNEDCDAYCGQYHTETCKAVNIAQAKRALREQVEVERAAREQAVRVRNEAIRENNSQRERATLAEQRLTAVEADLAAASKHNDVLVADISQLQVSLTAKDAELAAANERITKLNSDWKQREDEAIAGYNRERTAREQANAEIEELKRIRMDFAERQAKILAAKLTLTPDHESYEGDVAIIANFLRTARAAKKERK